MIFPQAQDLWNSIVEQKRSFVCFKTYLFIGDKVFLAKQFLYFGEFKWQISAKRFLNHLVLTRGFLLYPVTKTWNGWTFQNILKKLINSLFSRRLMMFLVLPRYSDPSLDVPGFPRSNIPATQDTAPFRTAKTGLQWNIVMAAFVWFVVEDVVSLFCKGKRVFYNAVFTSS